MGHAFKDQKIILVTGKGGVGKTVAAAAVTQNLAQAGKKTLLVELGEKSFLTHLIKKPVGYKPTEWVKNADVCRLDGENGLKEFLAYYIRFQAVVDLFFENAVMKTFVRAAPALKELAMLGKITSGIRGVGPDLSYDVIVVDAFATGHFLALLDAPAGMARVVNVGPMGEQSRLIDEVLKSGKNTSIMVVTLAEELPIVETQELVGALQKKGFKKIQVLCNRWVDLPSESEKRVSQFKDLVSVFPEGFLRHVNAMMLRQKSADITFRTLNAPVKRMPFIFDNNALEKISGLNRSLGDVWKSL